MRNPRWESDIPIIDYRSAKLDVIPEAVFARPALPAPSKPFDGVREHEGKLLDEMIGLLERARDDAVTAEDVAAAIVMVEMKLFDLKGCLVDEVSYFQEEA